MDCKRHRRVVRDLAYLNVNLMWKLANGGIRTATVESWSRRVDYLGGDVKCSACGHTTSEGHAVILATGEGTPAFCPSCPVCQAEQKREPKDM
jgi:hypothetical protein